jgi:Ni2+-binding GTPase involved in maturation of urease and hydrogenase
MRLITFSGPPSSGKTSVIISTIRALKNNGADVAVVKMDCLTSDDKELYQKENIPVGVGLSGNLCPDHFFITNIEECFKWGLKKNVDYLITESAGLCNRCSPHISGVMAVCVIDNLMGVNTPKKIGPMLKMADIVIITKGDIVSQAEREVFAFKVRQTNSKCLILNVNGITGQGCTEFATILAQAQEHDAVTGEKLRFSMPAAVCSYCLGEKKIGKEYQLGNMRKVEFHD